MEIEFDDRKLRKIVNDMRKLVAALGSVPAKKLRARLDDIDSFDNAQELLDSFPRNHTLKGNYKDVISLDLDKQNRLLLRAKEPVPRKDDEGIDWGQVTTVVVIGREDTHG